MRMEWLSTRWHYGIIYSIIYIAAVFGLQAFMKNRERLTLQTPLIVWNLLLALFSLVGAARFIVHMNHVVATYGLEHSICINDFQLGVVACWGWQFMLSKVAELVDTLFVVLRKQKLMFLHWYHHSTVLIYCWFTLSDITSTCRWFSSINYTVHTLMYSYYAFRAMKFRIPKWVNIFITTLQLSQMVWGVYLNVYVYFIKSQGRRCDVSYSNLGWSFFMYFTYFLLFFNFFYHAYLKRSPKQVANASKKAE